ncbi:MAG: hypothetical protein K6G67_08555 [Lachnospiraceae bacterium]|nr:hypothetical protein [Lachnospiraceae bacterium]
MSGKLRLTAFLMVFAILVCRIGIVNVNAAEGVKSDKVQTELSGLRITDLSQPVAGHTLDFTARIRSNENVTWEIPVIWIDDLGNTAYEAQPGRKYYPSFALYIPEGYSLSAKASGGHLGIKLPDFLTELFGKSSVAFVGDAGTGITYITYIPAYVAAAQTRDASTSASAPAEKAPAIAPANNISSGTPYVDPYSDYHRSDDNDNYESGKSANGGSSPNNVIPYDPYKQVRIHCSENVIALMGESALNELVTLIKNKLEPQAVNLLKSSFEGYSDHASSLGKQIGMYIYYESGSVTDAETGKSFNTPNNALAYVSGSYFKDATGEDVFKYILGIDTATFMEQNPDTGKWQINHNEEDNLENTLVHEMMHAFMDDYTRRGMMSDGTEVFPTWFTEGLASAVENIYQFRSYLFQTLGKVKSGDVTVYEFKDSVNRYVPKDSETDYRIPYSNNSILSKYTDTTLQNSYRYNLSFSNQSENTGSAYVSGYLAIVYLGYLTAVRDGYQNVVTPPDYENGVYPTVDMDSIRYGAGRIIDLIHEGYSLDSIISHISARPGEDTGSYYADTAAFESSFIRGTNEDSNIRTIKSGKNGIAENVLGSLEFCNYYLNFLENNSYEDGDSKNLASGCILSEDQHLYSPLDQPDIDETSEYYRILDTQNFVTSTVSDADSWDISGATHYDTHTAEGSDTLQGAAAAAAKPIEVIPSEDVADVTAETESSEVAAPETAVSGSSASEPTVSEPVASESSASEPVASESSASEPAASESSASEPAVSQPVPSDPVEDTVMPQPIVGVEPQVIPGDSEMLPEQLVSEGEPCTILPHEEDAIVPEYDEPVAQPSDEPDGDGGNDGDTSSSDDSSDDGSDDSSDDGSDDSSDSGSDSGDESSSDDSAAE